MMRIFDRSNRMQETLPSSMKTMWNNLRFDFKLATVQRNIQFHPNRPSSEIDAAFADSVAGPHATADRAPPQTPAIGAIKTTSKPGVARSATRQYAAISPPNSLQQVAQLGKARKRDENTDDQCWTTKSSLARSLAREQARSLMMAASRSVKRVQVLNQDSPNQRFR